jgi:hypothetical protein
MVGNLIVMKMYDFDVILGMDWLATHHAVLDCKNRRIYVMIPGGEKIAIQGEKINSGKLVISTMKMMKQIQQKNRVYLAMIELNKVENIPIENVEVINNFMDVFPKELDIPPT